MTDARLAKIEKRFVHKSFEENVHISEIYREIPGLIPGGVMARVLTAGGDGPLLLQRTCICLSAVDYAYTGYPVVLSEKEFADTVRRSSGAEVRLLEEAFVPGAGRRALDPGVLEDARHERLLRLFQKQGLAATEREKKIISDLLEEFEFEKPLVFRGRLIVDPRHAYWFEHPNEHIPGMLLIEGGRQMGLAVGHRYGGIPFAGVHNVIGEMNARFFNYADISHEIAIKTVVEQVRTGREGFWTWGLIHIHFFQHEHELGRLTIDSAAVKSKVLNRIRSVVSRPGYRYVPHTGIDVKLYLERDGRRVQGLVANLHWSGFQVQFAQEHEILKEGEYGFVIFYEPVGFIAGSSRLLWSSARSGAPDRPWRAGFAVLAFQGEEDRRLLDELLKRYFYVHRYG